MIRYPVKRYIIEFNRYREASKISPDIVKSKLYLWQGLSGGIKSTNIVFLPNNTSVSPRIFLLRFAHIANCNEIVAPIGRVVRSDYQTEKH
jgi:hypothetical protein